MEVGVCGRRGHPAQWPVAKDRSPEYDTVMLPYLSWGAKTVREMGERLRPALPARVPVSFQLHSKAASLFHLYSCQTCKLPHACLMAPLRQPSPCVMSWPPVSLSGDIDLNQLNMFPWVPELLLKTCVDILETAFEYLLNRKLDVKV